MYTRSLLTRFTSRHYSTFYSRHKPVRRSAPIQNYGAIFSRSSSETQSYLHDLCHSLQQHYQVFLIGPGLCPYTGDESDNFIHVEPDKDYFNYVKQFHGNSLNCNFDELTQNNSVFNPQKKSAALFVNSFCCILRDSYDHKTPINFTPFDTLIVINSFGLLTSLTSYYKLNFPNQNPHSLFSSDIKTLATDQHFDLTRSRKLDSTPRVPTITPHLSFEMIFSRS